MNELLLAPIGFARTPFVDKAQAPRQAVAGDGEGTLGTVEILPQHAHALADLDGFDRIWLLFWFHLAERATGKVLPPRSSTKRGVFATRSPHRPNPIGMSAVRLVRIDGLVLTIRDLDLVDGTPIVDVKPYIAYADAFPDASPGWLAAPTDPEPAWSVVIEPLAEAQIAFVDAATDIGLRARIVEALSLGPHPHPYRRIKKRSDGALVLAAKEWRARFTWSDRTITVAEVSSGYRERDIATDPALALHRTFLERWPRATIA